MLRAHQHPPLLFGSHSTLPTSGSPPQSSFEWMFGHYHSKTGCLEEALPLPNTRLPLLVVSQRHTGCRWTESLVSV